MSKPVRIFLGISGALLGLLVILILGFLIFTTATEFSPDLKSKVEIAEKENPWTRVDVSSPSSAGI